MQRAAQALVLLDLLYGSLRDESTFDPFLRRLCEYTGSHIAGILIQDFDRPGGNVDCATGV
jgi:hypothetical protein